MAKAKVSRENNVWQTTRLVSGISVGKEGPSVRIGSTEQPFFLRQSSLDCACGPNCLFMALIAFGFFAREALTEDGVSPSNSVRAMWRQAKKYHFVGTGLRSLRNIIRPVARHVEWKVLNGTNRNVSRFVLERLADGQLVLLGVENARENYYHWTLVVGVEGTDCDGVFMASRLLLVDPNLDQPFHTPWNNTIAVQALSRHGRMRLMRSVAGIERLAVLNGAIAIGRRNTR